jgi:hypothetical protein
MKMQIINLCKNKSILQKKIFFKYGYVQLLILSKQSNSGQVRNIISTIVCEILNKLLDHLKKLVVFIYKFI